MTHAKVLYFSGEIPQGNPEGDQRDLFRKLHLLSKERQHPILASFIDSVTTVFRDETRKLTHSQRHSIPAYESVLDLTDHIVQLRKTPLGGAIERVLVHVFQLGSFIAYHEANPLEYNFHSSNTSLIARGSGLLSAAAVGLSPSISTIPIISEDITRIVFRWGLIVDQACRSLEVSPDEINADGAWVYCAHGVDEKEAIELVNQFNLDKAYPKTSKAFVFNVDGNSVSIGGPPLTLKALFSESTLFNHVKCIPMRKVQGMWHTETAYGSEHISHIVSNIDTDYHMQLPLYSPVTGRPFDSTNATTLFNNIVQEMLTQRLHWDSVISSVTDRLKQISPDLTELISIQPSHYMETLRKHCENKIPTTTVSTRDIISAVMRLPLGKTRARDAKSSKIAVVGMACRFPGGAVDTEKYWELLEQARDVHRLVPEDRFNAETHVDSTGKTPNTTKTGYGCFVENPGLFDAMFFGMSPREAEQTDPMHRLAIVTAYEALESAGYVHGRGIDRRRVGTFYGQASDDYREVNSGQDIGTYFIPGGCRAFAPGRINYVFKFWGPSYSIDTACSSSLAAIQTACTSLWHSDVDMAIAGGLNILTNSDIYAGLSNGHFLSPTGGCKTWDESADGYCRADGVGSIILKRLSDAEADNDNILGVILSAATDHSAEAVSITHPHDAAQAHLYTQVVRRAGIDPLALGYIEMHGTGTQAGDGAEMRSVVSVFAPSSEVPREVPLYVGTAKSNVGHGEAAAGIMSFVKTMLVLQKGIIPPHIGIKTRINPALPGDLKERGVVIPHKAVPWGPNANHTRLGMINNFGAAGGNTCIIVEEAKPRARIGSDPRQAHVITVSAKTPFSLKENLKRLVDYLEIREDVSVADLSYTLSARKLHYKYRVSVLASSCTEAIELLRPHIETSLTQKPHSEQQTPVAFAFTGQGMFYIGLGAQLYRDSPLFLRQLRQFDGLAQRQGFASFLSLVDGTGLPEDITTVTMHLAIVCVEIALARLWMSFGITPSVVIGHSLGEYAAFNIAGVLSDSATVFLVGTRAILMDSLCSPNTHGMLSARTSVENIEKATGGIPCEIACINSPNDTVVGGSLKDLEEISVALSKEGHRTIKLDVAHAYHTIQMEPLLDEFLNQTRAIICKRPTIPIISPRYARVLTSEGMVNVSYLAAATRETVNFAGALTAAAESGILTESTVWLEIGHHPICSGLITRTLPFTRSVSPSLQRDQDNWTTIGKAVTALYTCGLNIDWNEYHRAFEPALRLLDTPLYAWNNANYWIQYRGDWNLTKGIAEPTVNGFHTTAVHRLISEEYKGCKAHLSAESNMTDPSLQGVIDGHAMNGHGVASSFLHAEMAFTLATRIQDQSSLRETSLGINVADFEYHEPVVKLLDTMKAQPIKMVAEADLDAKRVNVQWFNPANELWYCHATVLYEDSSSWLSNWSRSAKLVSSRIEALNYMAATGKADKLRTDLAYSLFGKLVDYSKLYRTMQWVILNGDEAVAEVVYPHDTGGTWTFPPHFVDGVVSLSGFILNGGTHFDNINNFFVTPSWKSMRFARPLTPGGRYLTYVRMVPTEKHSFIGDVYIMQNEDIIGVVEGILFREWPRVMLNRFFTPADAPRGAVRKATQESATTKQQTIPNVSAILTPRRALNSNSSNGISISPDKSPDFTPSVTSDGSDTLNLISRCLTLVAEELAIDEGILTDETRIIDLGLDSLMSLVISQRLREDLKIEVRDSFFLEISTVGDMKKLFI